MSAEARPRQTFPKRLRLVSARQFRDVYDARVAKTAGGLTIHARPNGLDHARLGLAVPRRVGPAVTRNRIKRLLRESFRTMQHELPAGYDLVVQVRPHEVMPPAHYERMLRDAAEALHEKWSRRTQTPGTR